MRRFVVVVVVVLNLNRCFRTEKTFVSMQLTERSVLDLLSVLNVDDDLYLSVVVHLVWLLPPFVGALGHRSVSELAVTVCTVG